MFDAILSGRKKPGEMEDDEHNYPMNKTKQITKNYNTRIFFKGQKPRVSKTLGIIQYDKS